MKKLNVNMGELKELQVTELGLINGGFNLETIGKGFLVVTGTIGSVCLLTAGAAATAAVSTIAAPVVAIGVAGAALGGAIMGYGITH